jgi:trimethylamine---corrinoid protein Co-methyltransferase
MEINTADQQSPQFNVLSERQCQELYLAALECIERIGVLVHSAKARQLLAKAGASVEDKLVKIPQNIIQQALVWAPRTFRLWDREGLTSLQVAPNRVYFGPGPTCTYLSTQKQANTAMPDVVTPDWPPGFATRWNISIS